jgi:heme-degrading monooxygenase HmoA
VSEPFAPTPEPPYWVVLFTSRRTAADPEGYARMAGAMESLAATQPGYLGLESVRDSTGMGVTLSYWRSEADIAAWKRVAAHQVAQRAGHESWYEDFRVRVARVERAYAKTGSPREGL